MTDGPTREHVERSVAQIRDQATDLFRKLVGLDDDVPIVRAEFEPDLYRITYLTDLGQRTDTVYWSSVGKALFEDVQP